MKKAVVASSDLTLLSYPGARFAEALGASLLRSGARAAGLANAVTWGLWEPALFVVFLFLGRVWCNGLSALDLRGSRVGGGTSL